MSTESQRHPKSTFPVLQRLGMMAILATTVAISAQRYHVHTYTELDGLPGSGINSIAQDSLGRMWFATRSGLASFDGARWRRFGVHDGLASLDQVHVLIDANARVWTLSHPSSPVLSWFDGERWCATPTNSGLTGDRSWAATLRRGDRDFIVVGVDRRLGVWDGNGWRSQQLGAGDGVIRGIHAVADECLVHASRSGLLRFDPHGLTLGAYEPVAERSIYATGFDTDTRRLWIVTRNQTTGKGRIGVHDQGKDGGLRWLEHDQAIDDPTSSTPIALADSLGGVYFGTRATLYYYHPKLGLERLERKNGLVAASATALCLDREHHVWVGGNRGVTKILGRHFAGFDKQHGLLEDEVSAVIQRRTGEMILGHPSGLTILGRKHRTIEFPKSVSTRVMDLTEGPDGRMWIAGSRIGFGSLDADDRVAWSQDVPGQVYAVRFDHGGSIWIGTREGLYRRGENGFERVEAAHIDTVRRLYVAPDGAVYAAASASGLFRFHAGEIQRFRSRTSDAANQIYAIRVRPAGGLWIGTLAGLYRTSGDELVVSERPRIDHPVYFILESGDETWFGTDHGVLLWKNGALISHDVRTGLIGQETNRAAGLVDTHGRVWIGTDQGVSIYDRNFDRLPVVPPSVQLLHIDAEGEQLPIDAEASLESSRSSLVFPFRAISFADENGVRFRTYLEGFDPDWTEPRRIPLREVRYTNLSAGAYRFHLQAIDVHGRRSAISSSAVITIHGPLWAQTWFRVLAVLLSIAVITVLVSFVAQRRHARRLEVEVGRRTEEIRQLESERAKTQRLGALGVLAGGIAHDFNNLLTGIMGNLSLLEIDKSIEGKTRELVDEAMIASNRARSLTTQLLTFAKGGAPIRKATSIQNVVRECCSFILSGSNIRCDFDLPDDLRPVEIDEGQMSQVINNLVLNAREAMPEGGTVHVRGRNLDHGPQFLRDRSYVLIEFEDDGAGIPPELLDQVFDPYFTTKDHGNGLGLASAYSIVERHDGRLTVDSRSGRGALFRMYLPTTDKEVTTAEPRVLIPRPASGCVLVMDDEASVCSVIERILTDHGYACLTAPDGEKAIAIYEAALHRGPRIEAVILDLTIPGGLGGIETARRLAEIDPEVRMLVATGYSNDAVLASFAEYGFCGRIGKPFVSEELIRVVDGAIRGPRASTKTS